MTKRSLKQIQENLAEQFYKYRRRGDDLGPEMGGGSFGLGSVTRSPSQFGGGVTKTQKPATETPPPPVSKPRVQMKPGETQDQAMLRTRREELAKSRNDQAGAKVWRPGEGKPKVWRTPDGKSSSQPPGRAAPGGGDKQSRLSADRASRTDIPEPLTAKEKRSAAYKSGGIHAAAALAAILGLTKDKDKVKAGGAEPGADDSGVTWVDTKDFVPTDTKDTNTEPKPGAAAPREPSVAPEEPIQEPEIRLEPIKIPKKPDVTRPDEKSAEPELLAPKKEKTISVPIPEPEPSVKPGPVTVTTPGGASGQTNTPAIRPKDQSGTTPGGVGTKLSPDGTSTEPGIQPGPSKGPGTAQEYKPYSSQEKIMKPGFLPEQHDLYVTQLRLLEKYSNFLQDDNSNLLPESQNKFRLQEKEEAPKYTVEQYIAWAKKYADQYGVPVPIVLHSMFKETGWMKNAEQMRTATSPRGATGVMQIMPQYAEKGYGIKVKDLTDPEKNIEAGVRGLGKYLERYKTPEKALAAYNAGEAGAAKFLRTGDIRTLPAKETRQYVSGYKDDIVHQLEKFYPKDTKKIIQVATKVLGTPIDAINNKVAVAPRDTRSLLPTTKKEKTAEPGYYTVGDSHGQGIAVYGKGKDGPQWINKSKVGASVVDKDQFAAHMANIESIPPGSVVTISGGANDIGRSNHQAIVNNLNKMIAAAKARGLTVVYALPTESPDPAKKEQREALRQTLLAGVKDVPIVDLGMASKTDKQQVHLDPKGYKNIAKTISDIAMPSATAVELPADGKPVGTIVQPDYSKYKVGDLGPLEKIGSNQWRSTTTGKIVSNAPELENLPAVPKPESFLDKLQRAAPPVLGGKGELVSQVFGDKKKSAASADTPPDSVKPIPSVINKQPTKDSGSINDLFKKLYGTDKAKEVQARWAAEVDKKASAPTAEVPKSEPTKGEPPKATQSGPATSKPDLSTTQKLDPAYEPGTAEYDARMEKLQVAAGDKFSREREARLKAAAEKPADKIELQRDQAGLVKAKRELSDFERAFAAARKEKGPGATFAYTDPRTGKTELKTTALKGEKIIAPAVSKSSGTRSTPQALTKDLGLDAGEQIVDMPKSVGIDTISKAQDTETPVPSSNDIQQAMQDVTRQVDALDADEEIVNLDDLLSNTDKDTTTSSVAGFKESINTQSNNDLLEILRLAGRK